MEPSISPRGRAGNTPLSSAGARCLAALRRRRPSYLVFVSALGLVVTAPPASAGATTLYAYAAGGSGRTHLP